ncbi:MAG: hypothetical protein ABF628_08450 [Acetobacter orientalis]|uniref:hypothetical protein n=1 Tax=Acetobacter orientalis TaxID=146474 RepID=UPI0039E85865
MTDKKWWTSNFPSQYCAFATDRTLGGYPIAGLANLDIYSSEPAWLTASTTVVALTQAEWLSIVPVDLIIKDGKVQTYVAPVSTDAETSSVTAATAATASTTS